MIHPCHLGIQTLRIPPGDGNAKRIGPNHILHHMNFSVLIVLGTLCVSPALRKPLNSLLISQLFKRPLKQVVSSSWQSVLVLTEEQVVDDHGREARENGLELLDLARGNDPLALAPRERNDPVRQVGSTRGSAVVGYVSTGVPCWDWVKDRVDQRCGNGLGRGDDADARVEVECAGRIDAQFFSCVLVTIRGCY